MVKLTTTGRRARDFVYIAKICKVCNDDDGIDVQFMAQQGTHYVDNSDDVSFIPTSDILMKVEDPLLHDLGTRPKYYFPHLDMPAIAQEKGYIVG